MAQRSIGALPRVGRVQRRPNHPFILRQRPYVIQPFFLAPVLPGETMKSLLLQSRVVTDPIKNRLIGWWAEYYFFYVKHRDLDQILFEQMMLDQDTDLSSLSVAAKVATYHASSGLDWVQLCLDRIVEEYFRDEEDVATHEIDSMPIASINQSNWLDSMVAADTVTAFDVEIQDGADSTDLMASEIDTGMRMWEFARQNGLTDMDYEDYLATFGISRPRVEKNVPELVRYLRKWQYPSNTIDPSDGSAASAVSWAVQDKADKDRFFREPGFLIGVSVIRPKVYLGRQAGSASQLLNNAMAWLPRIMSDDPMSSGVIVPDATVLGDNTDADGAWVDIKDLFLYGEQYVNFAMTATDANMVALPTVGLEKKYASSTDIDALFAGAAPANKIEQDGIVSLVILGSMRDTTPPTTRLAV